MFLSKLLNSDLTIEPTVAPALFGRVNAFNVRVQCSPVFRGTDKELMQKVCEILTRSTNGDVELRTENVVYDASFNHESCVETLVFQVLTPLEPQW